MFSAGDLTEPLGKPDYFGTVYEAVLRRKIDQAIDASWRPSANNTYHAIRIKAFAEVLGEVTGELQRTGIERRWKNAYDLYKLDGGRAKFIEIW